MPNRFASERNAVPRSREIESSLTHIANDLVAVAILWHVVLVGVSVLIIAGFRPDRREAAGASCVPLWSVALVAWCYENPFNASLVGALAAVLTVATFFVPAASIVLPPRWAVLVGCASIAFAWVYPHFLAGSRPAIVYLVAAPLGLLPCPTLAFAVGVALVTGLPAGRGPSLALGVVGVFYALFGALKLGVVVDFGLLASAGALLLLALRHNGQRSPAAHGTRLA
jgi:hypothetical protein